MTRHKTISTLSIAVIALFAAAVPSLAQSQSDRFGKDTQSSVVAAPAIDQTLALSREFTLATNSRVATSVVERTSLSNTARTSSPIVLSANAFEVPNQFTSTAISRFANQQVIFSDAGPNDPSEKKQFSAADYESDKGGTKRIAFVPARGQMLPG